MKNLRRYYVVTIALSAFLGSCEKEETLEQVPTEQSIEIEADIKSSDLDGKSFVITKDGEKISEEEYLKRIEQKSNSSAKSSNTYSYNISGADMDKLGMRHADARTVMDRYKANQAWLNYPNVNIYGLLVGCRPFGNSRVCNGGNRQAKWEFTRENIGTVFTRSIRGPIILTEREKKGLPWKDVTLGGQRAYDYQVSINSSVTNTFTVGSKIGFKASAEFFGVGTEISTEINLTHANATTTGRTTNRTDIINFSEGDYIPKGKKCDFRIYGEERETVQKYRVKIKVKGPAYVRFTAGSENRVRDEADGAKYAFPNNERNGITSTFEVKSKYWRYHTERLNCRNL